MTTGEAVLLPPRLRDDPDFRRFWLARVCSLSGSLVTVVALPVLVYRLSGSAFLTALVTMLEATPYLLFGLFAGALADRWNRKRVMVTADLVNALLIASVPAARARDPHHPARRRGARRLLGDLLGVRTTMVALSCVTFVAVIVAWTSPLRSRS